MVKAKGVLNETDMVGFRCRVKMIKKREIRLLARIFFCWRVQEKKK